MEAIDEPILDLSSTTATTTTTGIKGKRTKRLRAVSSSSLSDLSGSATEEEEDMANCLILLAQGGLITTTTTTTTTTTITEKSEKFSSKKSSEAVAGLYVYECKTCNKCFPSFQALGGHRASHKKPKILNIADEKRPMIDEESIAKTSNKPRVHECSICGSEFSSGQALGGHMRRHRPLNMPETTLEEKKERTLLSLDLNLPAPPEDGTATFPFSFSVSKLVDCHY